MYNFTSNEHSHCGYKSNRSQGDFNCLWRSGDDIDKLHKLSPKVLFTIYNLYRIIRITTLKLICRNSVLFKSERIGQFDKLSEAPDNYSDYYPNHRVKFIGKKNIFIEEIGEI